MQESETVGLAEAAKFLRMSEEMVRRKAKCGEIPAAKPGKQWVFIVEDLTAYLRQHYQSSIASRSSTKIQQEAYIKCHYTSAKTLPFGGSTSRRQAEKELENLLKQRTNKRH